MGKTEENLKEAFAGESQANRKYLAYSQKAEEEGYRNVAKLFRVAAESETAHALNHLKAMGAIKDTLENVIDARKGEYYESHRMYRDFIAEAKEESKTGAQRTFEWAIEAEKTHLELYQKAEEALKQGKDMEAQDYYVCGYCGYTAVGEAPEKCPACGSPKKTFRKVE